MGIDLFKIEKAQDKPIHKIGDLFVDRRKLSQAVCFKNKTLGYESHCIGASILDETEWLYHNGEELELWKKAPEGISIWKGEFKLHKQHLVSENIDEIHSEAIGTFRRPAQIEINHIMFGNQPWNGDEYTCDHDLKFDIKDVNKAPEEIRSLYPRLIGLCPHCGYNGIAYVSTAHYVSGDW